MANAKGRSESRRLLRRKLEAQGYSPASIERAVAEWTRRNLASNEAKDRQARLVEQEAALRAKRRAAAEKATWAPPSDKGYKPTSIDPILVGAARATGQTAAAAKRRSTMTAAQYHRFEVRKQ